MSRFALAARSFCVGCTRTAGSPIGHPWFWTEAQAAEIRAEGERVVEQIEAGAYPFDGTFVDFRPGTPATVDMPWWWDQVVAHQVTPRLPEI
jgi:hypothetical protein